MGSRRSWGRVTEFGFRSSLAESPHGRRRSCEEREKSSSGGPSQEWRRVFVTCFEEPVVVACESLAEIEPGLLRGGEAVRPSWTVRVDVVVFVDVMIR